MLLLDRYPQIRKLGCEGHFPWGWLRGRGGRHVFPVTVSPRRRWPNMDCFGVGQAGAATARGHRRVFGFASWTRRRPRGLGLGNLSQGVRHEVSLTPYPDTDRGT